MSGKSPNLDRFLAGIDRCIFSADPVTVAAHSYDATNEFHYPSGVVRPRHAADVGAVLRAANESGVCLFPRGAGTGFSGGSLPAGGGVVIDFLGMSRILNIDEESMTARVEPGVVTLHLQNEVEKCGLYYPPDPASLKICTIGGNVAENAGGPHCLKYGVTRDYVLALDGFTADGRPFGAGKGTLKDRAGYDLKHLFIGSEGTLAVFTGILLRLLPKPETRILFSAWFADLNDAAVMVNTLLRRGIAPSSLEFMDRSALQAVESYAKLGINTGYEAVLIVEIDGRSDEMPHLKRITQECLAQTAAEINVATEKREQEALWEIRRKASPAMRAFGNKKANEDIVVPRRNVPACIRELRALAQQDGLNIISFGHIGDGNIHVNIMYDGGNAAERERVERGLKKLFAIVNRYEGAVSGEHGIGIAKKRYLPANLDPVSYDLMRSIKRLFDPNGILNPGKMFY
ncbi:MAG TPA: FAD-linked oxidase C-terminal domain-containing protein [Candidatus Ozemobacteraceae bacterium]|mgnify:CR=1 FL=1|nr:FAD-linked oxidase C-terminal domain-containing protein [Candidatus Ozemobacteraceae bacterium]